MHAGNLEDKGKISLLHEQWDLHYLREQKTPRRSWYDNDNDNDNDDDNDDDDDGDDDDGDDDDDVDNDNHDHDNHDDNNDNVDKQFWFKTFNKKISD